jgi:hypothetical protein
MNRILCGLFLSLVALVPVWAAEPRLYPTGPAEDAAFIRFVNALGAPVEIRAGKDAQIRLDADNSSTAWQAVKARLPLKADLIHAGRSQVVEVSVQPSEFLTVAILPDRKGGWKTELGRESPSDFSAFKVSLGLMNLAEDCVNAAIKVAGKDVIIVEGVKPSEMKRRQINPLPLSVDLYCGDQRIGDAVQLGSLRAGDRWTLLVHPNKAGARLMPILDRMP